MAQTGYTPIQLYKSATASAAPAAGNLLDGELAINTNDGKLFYKDSGGVVQTIASTAAAAGAFTNLSYTGTLTGGTGVVNLGSGQFYKGSSGNVGIGTSSPWSQISSYGASGATTQYLGFKNADGGDIRFGKASGVDNGCILGTWSGNGMLFYTNSTERARIDSSGNLLVNKTSGLGSAKFVVEADTTTVNPMTVSNSRSTAATDYSILFYRNASLVGSVQTTLSGTSYVTTSDYRLKEEVQPMTGALAKVAALKPCTYKWKATGEKADGFIAHELAEVCPSAVTGEKDAVNEDGSIKPQGIDTSFLVATLTAAIQELTAKLTAAEARIQALEAPAAPAAGGNA